MHVLHVLVGIHTCFMVIGQAKFLRDEELIGNLEVSISSLARDWRQECRFYRHSIAMRPQKLSITGNSSVTTVAYY